MEANNGTLPSHPSLRYFPTGRSKDSQSEHSLSTIADGCIPGHFNSIRTDSLAADGNQNQSGDSLFPPGDSKEITNERAQQDFHPESIMKVKPNPQNHTRTLACALTTGDLLAKADDFGVTSVQSNFNYHKVSSSQCGQHDQQNLLSDFLNSSEFASGFSVSGSKL